MRLNWIDIDEIDEFGCYFRSRIFLFEMASAFNELVRLVFGARYSAPMFLKSFRDVVSIREQGEEWLVPMVEDTLPSSEIFLN